MKIENEISYLKRSANFNTVNHLERGIFENVYNCVLNFELEKEGPVVNAELPVPVIYDGSTFDNWFRVDLALNDPVLID